MCASKLSLALRLRAVATATMSTPQIFDEASSAADDKHADEYSLSEDEIQMLVHECAGFLTPAFALEFVCISLVWILFGYECATVRSSVSRRRADQAWQRQHCLDATWSPALHRAHAGTEPGP